MLLRQRCSLTTMAMAMAMEVRLEEGNERGEISDETTCECNVALEGHGYNVSNTNVTCSGCVFGDIEQISILMNPSFISLMSISFTNCSFIRSQVFIGATSANTTTTIVDTTSSFTPTTSSSSLLNISFTNCTFEGSPKSNSKGVDSMLYVKDINADWVNIVLLGSRFFNATHRSPVVTVHLAYIPSSVTIDQCVFENLQTVDRCLDGGALLYFEVDSIIIVDSVFSNNIICDGILVGGWIPSNVSVISSRFEHNHATPIAFDWSEDALVSTVSVLNSTFISNHGSSGGALALTIDEHLILTVVDSLFESSDADSGAIALICGSTHLSISNTVFDSNSNNDDKFPGGALSLTLQNYDDGGVSASTDINLSNCSFGFNTATQGGAIGVQFSLMGLTNFVSFSIADSTFHNNTALLEGGAIHSSAADLNITRSVFGYNEAPAGSALFLFSDAFNPNSHFLSQVQFMNNANKNSELLSSSVSLVHTAATMHNIEVNSLASVPFYSLINSKLTVLESDFTLVTVLELKLGDNVVMFSGCTFLQSNIYLGQGGQMSFEFCNFTSSGVTNDFSSMELLMTRCYFNGFSLTSQVSTTSVESSSGNFQLDCINGTVQIASSAVEYVPIGSVLQCVVNMTSTNVSAFGPIAFSGGELHSHQSTLNLGGQEATLTSVLLNFHNSTLSDGGMLLQSTIGYISGSLLLNLNVDAMQSQLNMSNTVISQGSHEAFIRLHSSNMTISNTVVVGLDDTESWVNCSSAQSFVWGDIENWHIDSECSTRYQPPTLQSINPDILLYLDGPEVLLEIILSETEAGVNISVEFQLVEVNTQYTVSEAQVAVPSSIFIYLVPSSCYTINTATPSEFIKVQLSPYEGQSTTIGFEGPEPSFMIPNANAPTTYCLVVNSTIAFPTNGALQLTAQFISNSLSYSEIVLKPKFLLYSHVFSVDYLLFDQWNRTITAVETFNFSSTDCSHDVCGVYLPNTSHGELFVGFNITRPWSIFTRVSVEFPFAQPAVAYGKLHYTSRYTKTLI